MIAIATSTSPKLKALNRLLLIERFRPSYTFLRYSLNFAPLRSSLYGCPPPPEILVLSVFHTSCSLILSHFALVSIITYFSSRRKGGVREIHIKLVLLAHSHCFPGFLELLQKLYGLRIQL